MGKGRTHWLSGARIGWTPSPAKNSEYKIETKGPDEGLLVHKRKARNFPGDPVAKTPCSRCRGPGFNIPGQGTGSHMLQPMMLRVAAKTWCSQINN